MYRVACPNFGYPPRTSDIYLSSQYLNFCTRKLILQHLRVDGQFWSCFNFRVAILFFGSTLHAYRIHKLCSMSVILIFRRKGNPIIFYIHCTTYHTAALDSTFVHDSSMHCISVENVDYRISHFQTDT